MKRTQTQLHSTEQVQAISLPPPPGFLTPQPPVLSSQAARDWKEITGRQGKRKKSPRGEGKAQVPCPTQRFPLP